MTEMVDIAILIDDVLDAFERSEEAFYSHSVAAALAEKWREKANSEAIVPMQIEAEHKAFRFAENYSNRDSGWGGYYGPMAVFKSEDGGFEEDPSIKEVSTEMLHYWMDRANKVQYPVFKYRYADLVWDFYKKVTGKSADVRMAQIAVNSAIEIVKNKYFKSAIEGVTKLERALSLAISINDTSKIKVVRDLMIAFEDEVAEDALPGLWGFCFDNLFKSEKVKLSEAQSGKIVSDLEDRLVRLASVSKENKSNPYAALKAATRLAKHYQRLGSKENIYRVYLVYGESVKNSLDVDAAMVGASMLRELHDIYLQNGMREDANSINVEMREWWEKSRSEMKVFSTTVEITKEEIENFANEMTKGSVEEALMRITAHYLPRKEQVKDQILELAKKAVFTSIIPMSITDHMGHPIATIGSVEDDIDGRIIHQMAQNMQFVSIFQRKVMEKMVAKTGTPGDAILRHLVKSPLFSGGIKDLVRCGIEKYLEKDWVSSVHILVPQIEAAFRQLLQLMGRPLYVTSRNGGLKLRTFDAMLHDEGTRVVLGEDATHYFRVLYTEQRGMNLRNNLCHGMLPVENFSPLIADRVLHSLLLLGLVKDAREE